MVSSSIKNSQSYVNFGTVAYISVLGQFLSMPSNGKRNRGGLPEVPDAIARGADKVIDEYGAGDKD
jgi:hypothetical protein